MKCSDNWFALGYQSHNFLGPASCTGCYRAQLLTKGTMGRSLSKRSNIMAGKNTAVFGIYRSRAGAEEAVDALRAAGFRNTDVSVLLPENQGTKDFAHEKGTKAPEGAATGATTGVVAGGVLGWLDRKSTRLNSSHRCIS